MLQRGVTNGSDRAFEFRHRNQAALEYVVVSKVILIGYPALSDGAKVTYWVIYSHDWSARGGGGRKGYVYPSVKRLAALRHASERSIQRHLAELITAALITREIRPGKPSVLYIEDPSEKGVNDYITETKGGDIFVGGGVTKMSPHKKEEKKQEELVNGVESKVMEERKAAAASGLKPMSQLLQGKKWTAIDRTSWLADEMLRQTGDRQNLGCYRVAAQKCPEHVIFQAIAMLKDARTGGGVRNRGAWFVAALRRLCREQGLLNPFRPLNDRQAVDHGRGLWSYNRPDAEL